MITISEWKAMGEMERTIWLDENTELSRRSESQRCLVYGVGVNDAPYCTQPRIDGKQVRCPAYSAWTNILKRAYSAKFHASRPTYSDVKVCDGWRSFSNFRSWWLDHHVDEFALDKDLLSDAGIYSPETCIFVPAWLNSFTADCGASRGE